MDEATRLTEVEIKLTHQERLVETLNDVIVELRKEMTQLHERLEHLEHLSGQSEDEPANDPPPHY